jgi:DNA repair exonuclease SbcCD ATPase subunit
MTTKSDQLREAIAECMKRYNEVTSERKALEEQVDRLQDERLRLIRESGNSPAQRLLSQRQKYYKKPDPMPMEAIGKVVQQARELSGQIADKVELENSLIAEKDRYVEEYHAVMGYRDSLGRRRTIARWGNRS